MADQFTTTSSRNYFQRLVGAVGGVLVGLILIIGAPILLFWNEGNFVRNAKKLDEGRRAVVTLNDPIASPENDGKLVHVTGDAKADGSSTDTDTGFTHTTLNMKRAVEMYQWDEDADSDTTESVGGSETTNTTYTYTTNWFSHTKDSSRFKSPEGHQNPKTFPIKRKEQVATAKVSLGDFRLSDILVSNLPTTLLSLEGKQAPLLDGAIVAGNYFYLGDDPDNPQVGDTRISYYSSEPGDYSIVAKQNGSTLAAYPTKTGKDLYLIGSGTKTADELFAAAEESNKNITWILRGVGFGAMFLGLMLILGPLSMVLAFIPFLKNLVSGFLGIAALIVSLLISSAVIAVAWLFYRPLVSVALIVLSISVALLVKKYAAGRKSPKSVVPSANSPNLQNSTTQLITSASLSSSNQTSTQVDTMSHTATPSPVIIPPSQTPQVILPDSPDSLAPAEPQNPPTNPGSAVPPAPSKDSYPPVPPPTIQNPSS